MANGFDRKGALIGVVLLVVFVPVGGALLALPTLSIKVTLPPATSAAAR
jgi:hypothetical protein